MMMAKPVSFLEPICENTTRCYTEALAVYRLGLQPIPVKGQSARTYTQSKQPLGRGWTKIDRVLTEEQVRKRFRDNRHGVGVVLDGRIIALDCDTPEAEATVLELIPRLNQTFISRGGRGLRRFVVRIPNAHQPLKKQSNRHLGLDLLGKGSQLVVSNRFQEFTWRIEQAVTPLVLDNHELSLILSLFRRNGEVSLNPSPSCKVLEPIQQIATTLYQQFRENFQRNDALYRASLRAIRMGYALSDVMKTLMPIFLQDLHHTGLVESEAQRQREGERTIRSAYKGKDDVRKYNASSKQSLNIGLSNEAREKLLRRGKEKGTRSDRDAHVALMLDRMYIGLKWEAGRLFTRDELVAVCHEHGYKIGSKTLHIILNRDFYALFHTEEPNRKRSTVYRLPSIQEVHQYLGVTNETGDVLNPEEFTTIKTYRRELERAILERRPSPYTSRWLGERLGVHAATINNYHHELKVVSEEIYETLDPFVNADSLPDDREDVPINIFVIDENRKKFPAIRMAVIMALKRGHRKLRLVRRLAWRYYRLPAPVEEPSPKVPMSDFFDKPAFFGLCPNDRDVNGDLSILPTQSVIEPPDLLRETPPIPAEAPTGSGIPPEKQVIYSLSDVGIPAPRPKLSRRQRQKRKSREELRRLIAENPAYQAERLAQEREERLFAPLFKRLELAKKLRSQQRRWLVYFWYLNLYMRLWHHPLFVLFWLDRGRMYRLMRGIRIVY